MEPSEAKQKKLERVMALVNRSDISSIRNVVSGIVRIINDPKSTAKDLKEIIQIDPPLTARVLRVANSVYHASRKEISELQQAIIWIGYDALKGMALGQKVCEIFVKDESIESYSRALLWKHSVAVAILAKLIYRREFGERGENIYAAGLLHDIGIIVEDQFFQDEFKRILIKSEHEKKNLIYAENEILGVMHTEIGKAITDNWHLPEELVVAIGCHHNPKEAPERFSGIISTLYIADYLCQERDIGYSDAPFQDEAVFKECLMKLGVQPHALHLIVNDMEQELKKMEDEGLF